MLRLPYRANLAVCGGLGDGDVNDRGVVGDGWREHCYPETGAYQAAQGGDVFTFKGELGYESRASAQAAALTRQIIGRSGCRCRR